ncbi:gallate 1-beta-glucosyltransferase-like [Aristolochia californica]|uniref:gallate 1-beta-glucosyltransferase-like n=1 Tax=Aristolochia californica TaxID=171875 RepID=UPI0035DC739A
MAATKLHVMVVTFGAQGLINPLLQFSKTLAAAGLLVTFAITESGGRKMQDAKNLAINAGLLQFSFFSDEWGPHVGQSDFDAYLTHMASIGPASLASHIRTVEARGPPISCIIGEPFLPWVADVAVEFRIPYALLWSQPYTVFLLYFRHYRSRNLLPSAGSIDATLTVDFPGLPGLRYGDLPTYLLPTNPLVIVHSTLSKTFSNLELCKWVFVNSFNDLELEVIRSNQFQPSISMVGPLTRLPNDRESLGDMWPTSNCLDWLGAQSPSSLVYISFGSYLQRSQAQMEEIAWALRRSRRPFLWVVKKLEKGISAELPEEFLVETRGQGKVVNWAPQVEVLSHSSIGCFLTHCGWNSSLETITSGVPVVAFPELGDQVTNAMLLEEVYKIGVRLSRGKDGVVGREEVERRVEEVLSEPRRSELKKNALRWREAARRAISDGGSSLLNIKKFVDELAMLNAENSGVVSATS